jgi:hypothetical protein
MTMAIHMALPALPAEQLPAADLRVLNHYSRSTQRCGNRQRDGQRKGIEIAREPQLVIVKDPRPLLLGPRMQVFGGGLFHTQVISTRIQLVNPPCMIEKRNDGITGNPTDCRYANRRRAMKTYTRSPLVLLAMGKEHAVAEGSPSICCLGSFAGHCSKSSLIQGPSPQGRRMRRWPAPQRSISFPGPTLPAFVGITTHALRAKAWPQSKRPGFASTPRAALLRLSSAL